MLFQLPDRVRVGVQQQRRMLLRFDLAWWGAEPAREIKTPRYGWNKGCTGCMQQHLNIWGTMSSRTPLVPFHQFRKDQYCDRTHGVQHQRE